MTKDQMINYLRTNRQYLNISAIAKDAGMNISALHNVIRDGVDGHGRPATLPEKHIPQLTEIISKMQTTRKTFSIVTINHPKSSVEINNIEMRILYKIHHHGVDIVAATAMIKAQGATKEIAFKSSCEKIWANGFNFELIKPRNSDKIDENPMGYLNQFCHSEVDYFDLLALNEEQTNWFNSVRRVCASAPV